MLCASSCAAPISSKSRTSWSSSRRKSSSANTRFRSLSNWRANFARPRARLPTKLLQESARVEGFEKFEVAGAGYINVRVNRAEAAAALADDRTPTAAVPEGKVLVEHSSINPNKAAHIGHLRNAILGDTFVRLLRFAGREVDIQNYIDNTGVQVADVVVGFTHIEKKSRAEAAALAAAPAF